MNLFNCHFLSLTVSVKHALTAAHCVYSRSTSNTFLRVGEHDVSTTADTSYTAVYSLSAFRINSAFDYTTSNNDIAIVVTSSDIQLNLGVGLVCLPFKQTLSSQLFVGATVTATGWGAIEFGAGDSNVLLKTNLNVIANSGSCSSNYPQASNNNNFMCTYTVNKDTCQVSLCRWRSMIGRYKYR